MVEKKKKDVEGSEWDEIDNKPITMEIGESIEGIFIGTRPGKFGEIFMLDNEKGERYNIYGGQQFEATLTPDKVGKIFRIKHTGIEPTSHGFRVRTYKFQMKSGNGEIYERWKRSTDLGTAQAKVRKRKRERG